MKNFLAVIIWAFTTLNLSAMCSSHGLSVFPSGSTLKQNSIIVIDGFAGSQDIINGLNKKYPVFLRSGKTIVKLVVKEILVGQFRLTQAVLMPETNLIAGLVYTLVIDKLPDGETLNRWNSSKKKREAITYKIDQEADTETPIFTSVPKEIKKTLTQYGCGPSIHVVFNCLVNDSSEFLIKATVKNIKTGIETSYYIEPYKKQIEVGHGMCSGAFVYDGNDNYEIEFSIMDASGNVTAWNGERIKFTKPTALNAVEEEGLVKVR